MKTLLHICCAPCSIMCIETLRKEGIEPTGLWFNPNIHPFTEYRARRNTLVEYAKSVGLALLQEGAYGLRDFLTGIESFESRCSFCYSSRLNFTAQYAAEHGFSHFTTTLLISPYQNHELLRETGEQAAKTWGVEFLYRDFRPTFREGQQRAREMGLYMQKYCGCIFSEEERYRRKSAQPSGAAG